MKRSMFFVFQLLLLLSINAWSQAPTQTGRAGVPGITITGKILDATNGNPLEYATVLVYSLADGRQVTGGVTDQKGIFSLADVFPGRFRMVFQYMGYRPDTLQNAAPTRDSRILDIGVIRLKPTVLPGEGVEVQADRPEFEYRIDKRVINVGQQQTALSGTAVDVLENVPSVTVDVEGNVQLRGSSNFTVLIDHRPTPLESNDALQQMPASIIDQIEIITNPSAKYEPDGTAGIINLITKKTKKSGTTGIFNANLGLDDMENRYGGDFLVNVRTSKMNLFLGADYNKRLFPGSSQVDHREFRNDSTFFRYSTGDASRGGKRYGIRGGADYSVSDRDLFSVGLRAGGRSFSGSTETRYDEWTEPGTGHLLYRSEDAMDRGGDFVQVNFDYKHDFAQKGHELLAQIILEKETGDEEETNVLYTDSLSQGQKMTEGGPEKDLRIKLDYTLPLGGDEKLEAGWQSRMGEQEESLERFDFNPQSGLYEFQSLYSHDVDYSRTIHSLYGIYANGIGDLGFQAGLRGEYTGRNIQVKNTAETFTIDRWDVFPTGHVSYAFTEGRQAMASYTRRIQRPRDWNLEPFETWMDAYNVRRGNPDLKPELIDSYEAAFQSRIGQNLFSVEAYYRVTHDRIDRVRSVYAPRVTLNTIENTGKDYALGSEIMLNVSPWKSWNINLMGNLYQYRVKGVLFGEAFERESFNWSIRSNNTLRIGPGTRLQVAGMFNSASVSSQGRREKNFMMNLGLRQEFFDRTLSATLQVRDAFRTGVYESTTEGPGFLTWSRGKRQAPVYTLTVTYNFHNYKNDRREENGNGEENGYGEEYGEGY
ncbi:TonB-dependent receptor [bacterium]|nr:TonB-dependent receptor [bacterium]